ncbi:MAG: hypothetical protein JW776_09225 [Candidatus Lokiarchaeota archaeon]|nr:hypothetical protein [Candidatus Lokiarchaeota archaeon]
MQKISIIVDTFSWKKLGILENKLKILDSLYNSVNVCITHEILKEINHFQLSSCDIARTQILPTQINRMYQDSTSLGFDEADASLISNLDRTKEFLGVSEDRPLLSLGTRYGAKIIQLIDLCQFLTAQNILTKNDLYTITKELRYLKNISKKKEKYMKKWLQHN